MTGSREIAELLRELRLLPDRVDRVDGWAQEIVVRAWFAKANRAPNWRKGGLKRAEKDLLDFGKAAQRLGLKIRKMRKESHDALRDNLGDAPDPEVLFTILARSIEAGRRAYFSLPENGPSAQAGRPEDTGADEILEVAAKAYTDLTGLPATYTTNPVTNDRGGPYPDFLDELFRLLGIAASAKYRTKRARTKTRKK